MQQIPGKRFKVSLGRSTVARTRLNFAEETPKFSGRKSIFLRGHYKITRKKIEFLGDTKFLRKGTKFLGEDTSF